MSYSAGSFQVGNAPQGASYAAPLVGFQLGQSIAGLPDQFMKGRENARKISAEDAFKDGVPTNPDGSIDVNAVVDKGAKIGGLPFVQQMLPFLQQMTLGKQAASSLESTNPIGSGTTPASPAANNPNGAGPSAMGSGAGQPQLAASGGDAGSGPGADTIRSIATEHGVDFDAFLKANPALAKVGASDAGLSPQVAKAVAARMAAFKERAPEESSGERASNGATPAPFMAGGSPPPQAASGEKSFADRFDASRGGTGLPAGYDQATAERYQMAARNLRAKAAQFAALKNPEMSAAFEKQAQAYDDRAKGIHDAITKNSELTGAQKDARDPSVSASEAAKFRAQEAAKTGGRDPLEFARQGEIQKADAKYYDSLHKGLAGSGMIAAQQKQNIDMLRQVAAAPSFMPGTGSELSQMYQRAAAQFGINTTGAAPREIFNQVSARILADQFSGLKSMASETGETGARIFKSMLDIEEKANITPGDTIEGIKAKLNLLDKTGDLMMKWADKADEYKLKHGSLDAGFDKELRAEVAKARIENVVPSAAKAPPSAPALNSEAEAIAWARKAGLKPGDPMKLPSGRIVAAP